MSREACRECQALVRPPSAGSDGLGSDEERNSCRENDREWSPHASPAKLHWLHCSLQETDAKAEFLGGGKLKRMSV
jgi:hypothetical protein